MTTSTETRHSDAVFHSAYDSGEDAQELLAASVFDPSGQGKLPTTCAGPEPSKWFGNLCIGLVLAFIMLCLVGIVVLHR